MNFKRLSENDIALILAIQQDNFPDGWNKEQLISGFNNGGLNAMALEIERKIVAIITYSSSIDTADIEGVVVINSERKKGYGKTLVNFILEDLASKSVEKVFLEVRESNVPAITLYVSCGFKQVSVRKKYYPDGENAVVMVKELI